MPVGFVNAAQSKELLLHSPWPHFTLLGRKGGSAVAAACRQRSGGSGSGAALTRPEDLKRGRAGASLHASGNLRPGCRSVKAAKEPHSRRRLKAPSQRAVRPTRRSGRCGAFQLSALRRFVFGRFGSSLLFRRLCFVRFAPARACIVLGFPFHVQHLRQRSPGHYARLGQSRALILMARQRDAALVHQHNTRALKHFPAVGIFLIQTSLAIDEPAMAPDSILPAGPQRCPPARGCSASARRPG